ncbi:MAG: ATP-binding cassette domain-containing protein [Actinomycetota bacterium]|nr:ATP-binding cassette domain-containing protein [Actinomycetota bacterium]
MTRSPLRWLGALLVIYLVAPVALFAVRFARAPERGFHVAGLFPSLVISLSCATVSLVLTCVLGIPLAYVLGRSRSALSRIVEVAVTLPLALPPVMGGIIVVYLVGPYSFLGSHLGRQLTNSVYGIIIAMTFSAAPFLVLSARAAFSSIDQAQLDVAATLGHSEFSRFVRVAVPLAGPEIRAGMAMTWLRAFGEYGAVTILAYNPASLPIYTVNQFMARGIAPTLAPTMLALVVAGAVVLVSRTRLPRFAHVDLEGIALEAPALTRSARLAFDVSRHLGTFDLDIAHVARHDNLAVLGPSGSGKSVLLRALAGIDGPSVGPVSFGEDDVSARSPERRRVGYVAQGFALFPHLTVWRNVMFATDARPGVARYWLAHLRLEGLENRYPSELSGGQRQRVALAQALCRAPEVLLLDEPFSALDRPIRRELQRELHVLQRETGVATVIVTHDPEEAAFLAQEILVIDHGRTLQSGTTRDLFTRPLSRDVARLLGISNLHRARTGDAGLLGSDGTHLEVDTAGFTSDTPVLWSIRPERIDVRRARETPHTDPSLTRVSATLADLADVGTAVDLFLRLGDDTELHARLAHRVDLAVGEACVVTMKRDDIEVWAEVQVPRDARVPLEG